MLRVVVSMVAALVGFSLGHSIPKWMESRKPNSSPPSDNTGKSSSSSSSSSSHPSKPRLRLPLRRKSVFKLKSSPSPHRSPSKPHSSSHTAKIHCSSSISSSKLIPFTSPSRKSSDLVSRRLLHNYDYEIKPSPAPALQISPSVAFPRVASLGSKTPELKLELSSSNKLNSMQKSVLQDLRTKQNESLRRSLGRSTVNVLLRVPFTDDRER